MRARTVQPERREQRTFTSNNEGPAMRRRARQVLLRRDDGLNVLDVEMFGCGVHRRIVDQGQRRTFDPLAISRMTVGKGKVRSAMPLSGNIEPGERRVLRIESEMPVVNRVLTFLDE